MVKQVEHEFRGERIEPVASDSPRGKNLTQAAGELFVVSDDAARVRLSQLGYLA